MTLCREFTILCFFSSSLYCSLSLSLSLALFLFLSRSLSLPFCLSLALSVASWLFSLPPSLALLSPCSLFVPRVFVSVPLRHSVLLSLSVVTFFFSICLFLSPAFCPFFERRLLSNTTAVAFGRFWCAWERGEGCSTITVREVAIRYTSFFVVVL